MIHEDVMKRWNKQLDYYVHLLQDPDLMPVRKTDTIPITVGLSLLGQMQEDIHKLRKEMMLVLNQLLRMNHLDELEELVLKQKNALEKVQLDNAWDYLCKGEDFSKE
jgi:Ni2+-binding GTPase involved in maturation of urease and hydrogenase